MLRQPLLSSGRKISKPAAQISHLQSRVSARSDCGVMRSASGHSHRRRELRSGACGDAHELAFETGGTAKTCQRPDQHAGPPTLEAARPGRQTAATSNAERQVTELA